MQNVGVAAVVLADARRDVARVCDQSRRAHRGGTVPSDEPIDERAHETRSRHSGNVLLVCKCKTTNGIDVTNVDRAAWKAHALRPRGRRAYDRIVGAKIERFEGARIERRQRPKVTVSQGNPREIRAAHACGGELASGDAFVVESRIDRRVGPRPRNVRKDPLRAPTLI